METARCGACGTGLVARRRYRQRRWVVVVGYALLLPALPVLPLAGSLHVYAWWEQRQSPADTVRLMREASVPKVLIEKARRGAYLPDERRAELTLRQRWAYDLARDHHEPLWGFGVAIGIVMTALAFGAALVAALFGALLVRKEDVLHCEKCGP